MVELFVWGMQKYPIWNAFDPKKWKVIIYLPQRNKNFAASYGFELILTAQ